MSLKYHPDASISTDTTKMMILINEAYYILKDPARKDSYDKEYIYFYHLNNNSIENNKFSFNDYTFYDNHVEENMQNAHNYASNIVDEFLKTLHNTTKEAAFGAWERMLPAIIGAIIFMCISICIKTCH